AAIVVRAEVRMESGRQTCARIGVDALEDRRAIGEIPETPERIVGACAARRQVAVLLLFANDDAVLRRVIAEEFAQRVAELVDVLREDGGCAFTLRRTETDAVKRQALNFDARDA